MQNEVSGVKSPAYWKGYHALCAIPRTMCRGSGKALLLDLWAKQGDHDNSWHSVRSLADSGGVSTRTIQRQLQQLQEQRLVTVRRRTGTSNEYSIHWPGVREVLTDHPSLFASPTDATLPPLSAPVAARRESSGDSMKTSTKSRRLDDATERKLPTPHSKLTLVISAKDLNQVVLMGNMQRFRELDDAACRLWNLMQSEQAVLARLALWVRVSGGKFKDGSIMHNPCGVLANALICADARYTTDQDFEKANELLKRERRLATVGASVCRNVNLSPDR